MFGEQAVCIPNIGSQERRKRLYFGRIGLILTIVILAAIILAGITVWWRLLLFLPLWVSMSGFFQARERT